MPNILLPLLSALLAAPLPAGAADMTAGAAPTIRDCPDCPDLVTIPAGTALLGSTAEERARAGIVPIFGDREGPVYRVTFAKPYAIGRTEITRGQYRAFADATRRRDGVSCGIHDAKADTWSPKPGYSWRRAGFAQDDSHPAVCISYEDAVAYTRWLAAKTGKPYRLPSDAEWEYAARGGTTTPYYWGNAPEAGCKAGNIISIGTIIALGWPPSMADRFACADRRSFTMPVASFPPNPFGLYDMAGNAFEMVADCNGKDNADAHADGTARTTGACDRHYLKGGAFHTPFWLLRPAVRGAPLPANMHMFTMGFRIARAID